MSAVRLRGTGRFSGNNVGTAFISWKPPFWQFRFFTGGERVLTTKQRRVTGRRSRPLGGVYVRRSRGKVLSRCRRREEREKPLLRAVNILFLYIVRFVDGVPHTALGKKIPFAPNSTVGTRDYVADVQGRMSWPFQRLVAFSTRVSFGTELFLLNDCLKFLKWRVF